MKKKKKYTKNDFLRDRSKRIKQKNESLSKTIKSVKKLRESHGTQQIQYPEYEESFDYVDKLFPHSNVKDVILYKVTATSMDRCGFGHAGGFYDRFYKTVVFTSKKPKKIKGTVCAKLYADEVIVHELLHYCYFDQKKSSVSTEINEAFAYGWSLGYLRKKGYTDEQIIEDNYLPFYFGQVKDEAVKIILIGEGITVSQYNSFSTYKKQKTMQRLDKKIFKKSKEMAVERARDIISIYSKKIEQGSISNSKENISRGRDFSILDLD